GTNMGAVVAYPVVVWLFSRWGWQAAFIGTGGLGFACVILWLLLYRPPPKHPWLTPAELEQIQEEQEPESRVSGLKILGLRQSWGFTLAKFMTDPIWWFYLFWLPKYLTQARGLSMAMMVKYGHIPFLTALVGSVAGGWLSGSLIKRVWSLNASRKTAMAVCAFLMPAGIVAVVSKRPWVGVAWPGATVESVSSARCWAVVRLLFAASFINYLDRATISMALPLISRDLGLDPTTKGVVLSALFWSYASMQIPIGWCADRFNVRWLYAGAFALWSVAQGLTGLAEGLAALVAFRILLGVGESIYLPGGTKIVSLLFAPKERGLPSGLFDFGTRTGLVLQGLLIPWLLVRYGWRTTFAVVGFSALLWLVPWLLVSPPRLSGKNAPSGADSASGPSAAVTAQARPRGPGRAGAFRFNRNLLGICLGFFCFDY